MVNNEQTLIKVSVEDVRLMRTKCKKLFLLEHPEFEKMKLTDKFLFHKLTEFYAK
jgi:hypothetical protein